MVIRDSNDSLPRTLRDLDDKVAVFDVLPLFEEDNAVLVKAVCLSRCQIHRALYDVGHRGSVIHSHIIDR